MILNWKRVYFLLILLITQILTSFSIVAQDLSDFFSPELIRSHSIKHYHSSNGLLQNTLGEIFIDENNYLWGSNLAGLFRMDNQNLEIFFKNNHESIKGDLILEISRLKEGAYIIEDDKRNLYKIADSKITPFEYSLSKQMEAVLSSINQSNYLSDKSYLGDYLLKEENTDEEELIFLLNSIEHYVLRGDKLIYFVNREEKNEVPIKDKLGNQSFKPYLVEDQLLLFSTSPPFRSFKIEHGKLGQEYYCKNPKFLKELTATPYYFNLFADFKAPLFVQTNEILWKLSISNTEIIVEELFEGLRFPVTYLATDKDEQYFFLHDGVNGLFSLKMDKPFSFIGENCYAFLETNPGEIVLKEDIFSLQEKEKIGILPLNWKNSHSGVLYKADKHHFIVGKQNHFFHFDSSYQKKRLFTLKSASGMQPEAKALLEDPQGRFWLGFDQQLVICDSLFRPIHIDSTLLKDPVVLHSLHLAQDGEHIWIGSNSGIHTIDLNKFEVQESVILPGIPIRDIFALDDEVSLISTYGDGIYSLYKGQIRPLPLDRNKSLLFAHCFLEDDWSYLWISSNNGLFKVNKENLLCYIKSRTCDYIHYHRFSTDDGLPTNEFNGGCQPCGAHLSNGELAFASIRGLVTFNPKVLSIEKMPNKIVIDKVLIDGKHHKDYTQLSLPANFKRLQIKVSCPYWGASENIQFEYKIDGFDEEWILVEEDGLIETTRFGHGQYTLQLRVHRGLEASAHTGYYLTRKIPINIAPTFRESKWFLVVIGLIGLGSFYLLFLTRTLYLKRRNEYLERQIEINIQDLKKVNEQLKQNISSKNLLISILNHDIASPFRFLSNLSTGIKGRLKKQLNDRDLFSDFILLESSIKNLYIQTQNYLTWIKTEAFTNGKSTSIAKIKIYPLVEEVLHSLGSITIQEGIRIQNKIPEDTQVKSNPDFFKVILYNLLDNSIKHSECKDLKLSVRIVIEPQIMVLQIHEMTSSNVNLEQLNEFFSSLENNVTTNIGTRGIGMYILKDVLKKNNAQLEIIKKDQTNLFEVHFPSA